MYPRSHTEEKREPRLQYRIEREKRQCMEKSELVAAEPEEQR